MDTYILHKQARMINSPAREIAFPTEIDACDLNTCPNIESAVKIR